MKVHMAIWAGGPQNLPAWFKPGEEAEVSWEQIQELYESGANVMLYHSQGENGLFVDDKRFGQR